MSSTYSAASADSVSALSAPECEPSHSAKSNHSREPSSQSIGQASPATRMSATLRQSDWLETECPPPNSSAEGIPANHSATPASSEARKILATSGRRCVESLAKSDRLGSLLKMLLVMSPWGSTRCSLIWKQTVTPGGRSLFRLLPLTRRTSGNESGSWLATATANQLAPSMRKWKGCREIWPTPSARDWKDTPGMKARRRDGRDRSADQLPRAVYLEESARFYPTMDYGAAKGRGQASADDRSRLGGSLNPEWVEWLMGFPPGWTALEPSEMPLSRKSLKSSAARSSRPRATETVDGVKP